MESDVANGILLAKFKRNTRTMDKKNDEIRKKTTVLTDSQYEVMRGFFRLKHVDERVPEVQKR